MADPEVKITGVKTTYAHPLKRAHELVFTSPAGFWHVWELAHSYGVYNQNGVQIASVAGKYERNLEMAKAIAVAFDKTWQW